MSAAGGSGGSTDRTTTPLSSRVLGIAIIAITGMQLMSTLDGTIVIVALPRMQAELDLSDAGKSWVITAYVLTFGGLLLLGGRVGDAIGHKRAFLSGVGVFTIASLVCGLATDGITLIVARAVQGTGAAVAAPTGLALIATTYAVGQARNRAMAVSAAMQGIGSVLGPGARRRADRHLLAAGVPDQRPDRHRHHRDRGHPARPRRITSGSSSTSPAHCWPRWAAPSAVLVFTQGPPRGWVDPWVIGAGVAAVVFFVAFLIVERTAENPLVPFSVFDNRNRVMTFISLFLAGGVLLTLTVMIGLLGAGRAGLLRAAGRHLLHPVRGVAFGPRQRGGRAAGAAHRAALADHRRRPVGAGRHAVRLDPDRTIPYFPDLFVPIVVGGFGIGMISVILPLCAVAEVGPREIGPVSAITLMVYNLGGPLVLVVIQAVQTSRTLYLGGTTGPVKDMTPAQLDALDHGYTYSLLWVAAHRGAGRRRRVLDRLLRAPDRHRAAHPRGGGGR